MSKQRSLILQYPLRMYAPTAGYGTPFMVSADRRSWIVKDATGYRFPPEIAMLEAGVYDDTPTATRSTSATVVKKDAL